MQKQIRNGLKTLALDIIKDPAEVDIPERLGSLGFTCSREAADRFEKIVRKLCVDEPALEHFASIVPAFMKAPHPEGALLNLLRYIESTGDPHAFLNTLVSGKPVLEILATIFGSSQYMADIIIRNPGVIYWLIEKPTWDADEKAGDFLTELRSDVSNFYTFHGKLNAVKRFHRKMLLKIGVRDLLGQSTIEKTTMSLSDLAKAIVGLVLELTWGDILEKPFPGGAPSGPGEKQSANSLEAEPKSSGFAVIAMGKLGGRELNYSSDIDLIYLSENVDDNALAFYRNVAERLTEALSEATDEGYLYRVDLRLRPDGEAGPLVNTFESMRIYYETRGKPWEFQAYLKSRVIAGDRELGEKFLRSISSLIFNPSLPYSPVEDIALLRARIQDHISIRDRVFNIKLMEGGIRDIEFIVQTLQLLHGAGHPEIRSTNTIDAIKRIDKEKLIEKWEAATLTGAYRFFRLIEHRLQMMHQIKTHSVPEADAEIDLLAHRVSSGPLGIFSMEEFLDALTQYLNRIRMLSESFFSGKKPPETSLLLALPEDDSRTMALLERYGITDVRQSLNVIQSMAYGSFPRLLDRKTRSALENFLPVLLEMVSRTGDPGLTLTNTAKVASASGNEYALYRLLADEEQVRSLLLSVTGISSYLTGKLCTHPEALDILLTDPESMLKFCLEETCPGELPQKQIPETGKRGEVDLEAVRNYLRKQKKSLELLELSAFVVDIKEKSLPGTLTGSLASFACKILSRAFASIAGTKQASLFVLGSFGVGEPRLKSDLDLLVVSAGRLSAGKREKLIKKVQSLNGFFAEIDRFKLDYRLRGEGTNAPLVQDLTFYKEYFESRIAPWEKIAFAKCRPLTGDPKITDAFLDELSGALSRPFSREEIDNLIATRQKLEAKAKAAAGPWETKRSSGGKYDIEYMCQAAMAQGAGEQGYPFSMKTSERLELLTDRGLLSKDDLDECTEALRFFSLVEYLMELQALTLPRSKDRRLQLARYMERTFALLDTPIRRGIEKTLSHHKRRVRSCYEKVFKNLG